LEATRPLLLSSRESVQLPAHHLLLEAYSLESQEEASLRCSQVKMPRKIINPVLHCKKNQKFQKNPKRRQPLKPSKVPRLLY